MEGLACDGFGRVAGAIAEMSISSGSEKSSSGSESETSSILTLRDMVSELVGVLLGGKSLVDWASGALP